LETLGSHDCLTARWRGHPIANAIDVRNLTLVHPTHPSRALIAGSRTENRRHEQHQHEHHCQKIDEVIEDHDRLLPESLMTYPVISIPHAIL
jgi:hypothetical protein